MKNIILSAIIFITIVLLCFLAENVLSNFVEWSFDNAPLLLIGSLILCAVIIIISVIDRLKGAYKKNPDETKQYIKQQIKITIISFVIAIVIMSIIIANVIFA